MTVTPDDEARPILARAIQASNDLIVHLIAHPDTFRLPDHSDPECVRNGFIEADYRLNSAATSVADLVGEFGPPTTPCIVWRSSANGGWYMDAWDGWYETEAEALECCTTPNRVALDREITVQPRKEKR